MSVYLDIILIENLCMNYIILFATGIVMKRKIKHIRLIIGSFIGSIYAIVVYLRIVPVMSSIFFKILLSILMVFTSFREEKPKKMLKDLLMFYLVSFVFGGCSFALIYFITPENINIKDGVLVGLYPIKITLIGGAISFLIIQIAFNITKNKLSEKDILCKIEININSQKIKIKALIDSGNMLEDPITKKPVIIVEQEKLKDVIPKEIFKIMNNKMKEENFIEMINQINIPKIRLIPFSSLGKTNGMLIGIKAESVKLIFKDINKNLKNVVIGMYDKKLSPTNKYQGLIGLNLIEGSEENEYITNVKR